MIPAPRCIQEIYCEVTDHIYNMLYIFAKGFASQAFNLVDIVKKQIKFHWNPHDLKMHIFSTIFVKR